MVLFSSVTFAERVLVTIGDTGQVTERQLESAMSAAPFSTQFPSMDEKDQAYLRGDMLLRLARSEALFQEAVGAGKNTSEVFNKEMGNFKTSLLAQRYLSNLRKQITVPKKIEEKLLTKTASHSDAMIAARSIYIAKHFIPLKNEKMDQLQKKAKIEIYFDRLDSKLIAETVLVKGEGLLIKYGDLGLKGNQTEIDKKRITDKVNEWVNLTLMAREAVAEGENVDAQLEEYAHSLTIRLLLAEKEQQWIPSEQTLVDYFQTHPDIAYIPERRQIGQIVLASKQQADEMLGRIKAGESLFELAAQYSSDPYGRQRSGDMGWLKEGSASTEIEAAIKGLQDNEVSDIVKTDKGWHIVTIVNRKPSERKNYAAIKDRVRQRLVAEKMTVYLKEVTTKHPLKWLIAEHI